jgi:hypothetical protein
MLMYLQTIAWIDVCVIVPDAGIDDDLIDNYLREKGGHDGENRNNRGHRRCRSGTAEQAVEGGEERREIVDGRRQHGGSGGNDESWA